MSGNACRKVRMWRTGVGGWEGSRASLVVEVGILPSPHPLKQLFRTTSPRIPCGIHILDHELLCLMGFWEL